jgi:hypothetical protein
MRLRKGEGNRGPDREKGVGAAKTPQREHGSKGDNDTIRDGSGDGRLGGRVLEAMAACLIGQETNAPPQNLRSRNIAHRVHYISELISFRIGAPRARVRRPVVISLPPTTSMICKSSTGRLS